MPKYPETQNQYTASLSLFESMKDKGVITQTELEEIKQYLIEKYMPLIL